MSEDARMKLDTVRRFALSLPEVVEAPHFDYGSLRLRGGRAGEDRPEASPRLRAQASFSICRNVESVCCR